MNEIVFKPIGIIRSPFKEPRGTPIQSKAGEDVQGTVELFPEYVEGLADLDGFSHVILVYCFHLSKKSALKVKPYMDEKKRGVFATRAPSRPNPIGISIVRLVKIEKNTLYVKDLDVVDGTPLLDIKPYVPEFDIRRTISIGWLERKVRTIHAIKDDGRFSSG